jgi:hypothetical protein
MNFQIRCGGCIKRGLMEKTPCSTGSFGGFIRPISCEIGMVFPCWAYHIPHFPTGQGQVNHEVILR